MAYVLRFVQRFGASDEAAFMALERQFAALERRKGWPRGRRSRPFAGREPANTLIWECELETLEEVNRRWRRRAGPDHARLLKRQSATSSRRGPGLRGAGLRPPRAKTEGVVSDHVDRRRLLGWCRVPAEDLPGHPALRVPFRLVADTAEMGRLVAAGRPRSPRETTEGARRG
jgi:hypothetical protein